MNININLSPREDQVTELLAWGASSKQVAGKLFISEDTVVNHRRNIFQKIGIHSIGQLCAWFFCKYHKIPVSLNPIPMMWALSIGLCVALGCMQKQEKKATVVVAKITKRRTENDCDL